ncbi:ankyrin 2,3/unc44, putative [Talaromyces stipitatus ATCC 10500]|uniref:Ankyrin 2,3/unc44, putative n=1 Tax=Talaromyces stipitatus (strain ATCC 10500 / CBS 375.48 / QM 6759 / NRRL 1006) TaxID=441959 RepID=B8LZZ4_TALSN|nr:ankyrin 2,3/unc44, putative [Talaromyces stipitatus ATCC 10500]EED20926.1 ankyrin 2,3/unc44, putative [Talaromyces stipitatus ATCC 10500]
MAILTLSHDDYTVAWVCALPVELAASQIMLDERHGPLPQAFSDDNIYTLGSLNGHNVVIACLPSGIYGTTSATTVLVQMLATFPSLQFGLMVGIGGGVPTNVDIRLGDVVISKPTGNGSGVIQYDYGKKTQAELQLTGFLNKPPKILLTAVSHLEKDRMQGKRVIKQIVMRALESNNDMRKQFSRPTNDLLFHATYQHQDGTHDCSTCDRTQLLSRPPRVTDEPDFHYGIIASGNQVMKDAETRDRVAKGQNILCFEMEAAGLMDQLPCLVVRGICDYSDSHKRKEWQGYAALTAAAYAKQLLSVILPRQRKQFTPEEEACRRSLFIIDPEENKNALKRRKGDRAPGTCDWIKDTDELRAWLASPRAPSERVMWFYGYPGTGKTTMAITLVDILLNQCDMIGQKKALAYFFCDSSSPEGCTATAILRGLLSQLVKQRPHLMKHLLPKFKERGEKLFDSFDALWAIFIEVGYDNAYQQLYCIIDALDECDQSSQRMLLTQITQSCGNQNDPTVGRIHFLIISRPFPEIREYLHPYRSKDLCSYQEVQDDLQGFIDQKINELALRKCYTGRTKRDVSRILKEKAEGTFLWVGIACEELARSGSRDAIKKLQSLPQGLHSLYAKLLEMALEADKDSFDTVSRILAVVATSRRPLSVPELSIACKFYQEEDNEHRLKFTEEYIDICRLMVVIQDRVVRLLHKSVRDFLLILTHPFSINELQVHASLANRCVEYILDNIGLLDEQVDQKRDSFLEYATLYWPEHAGSAGMEFNILPEYQRFFHFDSVEREVWLDSYRRHRPVPQRFSILHVAATWGIKYLLISLLFTDSTIYGLIKEYIRSLRIPHKIQPCIDTIDDSGRTPLHWAIMESQNGVVDLLLRQGANPDVQDNKSRLALHFAAEVGNENLVQLFARTPKSLEAKDVYGQSPLLIAVENMHAATIYRLVDAGAHIHTFNNMHQNALHHICKAQKSGNSCTLLAYFMARGVSIKEPDVQNMTPFLYAIACGRQDLSLLLLQNGYDVNLAIRRRSWTRQIQDRSIIYKLDEKHENLSNKSFSPGMTALHFSALNAGVGMTEFLCRHHADPNAVSETGDTPLHLAIRRRALGLGYEDYWTTGEYSVEELSNYITDWESEEASEIYEEIHTARVRIVDVLLSTVSIDVNIANEQGDCPLHVIPFDKCYASDLLLKLIEKGADTSKSNKKGQTCLHLACDAGNLDAVRILISRGCSTTSQDIHGSTPLHCAIRENRPSVVRLILEQHPQQLLGNCQQSGLSQAKLLHHHVKSLCCSVEIINLLLECGIGPNEQDENGDSVLSLYLRSFHLRLQVDVFDCLVRNGASMNWSGKGKESLIHLAMQQFHRDNFLILKHLLQYFDISAKDAKGRNVLHYGAIHGAFNKDLTNFLQEKNIFNSLHEKDLDGKTPLDYAEEEAQRKRHPHLFEGKRWYESVHNLRSLQEDPI